MLSSRRRFVLSAAALAAVPAYARAQTLTAIRVGDLGNTDASAEPLYAQATGIFKKHGLDASITALSGGGAVLAAVAGGALDLGASNIVSAVAAIERGIPVTVLTPAQIFTKKEPDNLLVKARGSKLRTGADLNGKTVAVTTLSGTLQLCAAAWIDKNGGDSKTVHFVEIASSAMAPALRAGRIDAAMLSEPFLTKAQDDVEELGDAFAVIAPEWSLGVFVASNAWLGANPDAARRFVAAMVETARWANAHHTETAKILSGAADVDLATLVDIRRSVYGDRLSARMLQPPIDAAFKYAQLKAPFDAAKIVADAQPYWHGIA